MADPKNIKEQRDRFLAFSFASADLFIEVAENGTVAYALGAAKAITGFNDQSLLGHQWLDLFSVKDRAVLGNMRKRAKPVERCGPYHVVLDLTLCGGRQAIVTAIRMPDSNKLYVTVGFLSELMTRLAHVLKDQENEALLDKDMFLEAAKGAIDLARAAGTDIDMTLLDITDAERVKKQIGDEMWSKFTQSVTDFLMTNSIDGHAAAQITEGRYSVIHDKTISSDTFRSQLEELSKQSDPEGNGFGVESRTVTSDLQSLNEREAAKALVYTINEFERKGSSINIETLNTSFKAYVSANAHKIHQFKSMVEQLNFDFHFMPIIDLESNTCSHFEMLSRFRDGGSTQEWVMFAEDIGMAADFDIAVCERAINYLLYKAGGRRTAFAINLSGQSIQNEQFFKTMFAKLSLNKDLAKRIIFEITDSTAMTELKMVNGFIKTLQKAGYRVCLDDFGAASASFQYLQQLDVDYVKINGQYTRKILESERDRIMVKNIAQMCNDLKITTVAEQIEEQEQADIMKGLGVALGQGFLFARPGSKPDYEPAKPSQ